MSEKGKAYGRGAFGTAAILALFSSTSIGS